MKRLLALCTAVGAALFTLPGTSAQDHSYTVNTTKPIAKIQPTMFGVFFEDINYAADGGMYAEMVENRSFETPQPFQGWDTMGKVTLSEEDPAFDRNPHYASLLYSGHKEKRTGMVNRGYFGMGFKEGMKYSFTVYARLHDVEAKRAMFSVELLDKYDNVLSSERFMVDSHAWTKFTAELSSSKTDGAGSLRLMLMGNDGVDVDHVSLFPEDTWNGLREDLIKDLEGLEPGVFRFPGGCLVEGSDLETRYQWKNTLGPAENRPLNENRWNNTYTSRFAPSYYQSLGLGFYEYFLLAERLGAAPLPIISVGLACQFHNNTLDAHVPVEDLGPYIQDALDLIEFANGPVDSKWGAIRAEMGHPAPFGMKFLGIGNEQWGTIFPERLEHFTKAVRSQYSEIVIVGSAGPSSSGGDFDYLWREMNRLGADLVDEHYYEAPAWFLTNAQRYDSYDRKGPKVFAGEYAAHVSNSRYHPDTLLLRATPAPDFTKSEGSDGLHYLGGGGDNPASVKEGNVSDISSAIKLPSFNVGGNAPFHKNNFFAALCEAAFMTGLERNADVVQMSAYAPLFAHAEGWQWDPDLIWFDNLSSVRTPSYYVQQMYGRNSGTDALSILEDGKKKVVGEDGMYATACFDAASGDYILKVVNAGIEDKNISVTFKGLKELGKGSLTTLHAGDEDFNTLEKETVRPVSSEVDIKGNVLELTIPARTFQVYRF